MENYKYCKFSNLKQFNTKNISSVDFFIVDAPILCGSFYVERIDLTSKLRKFGPKWQWNRPFSAKKSPHKFSNTDPSNLIISRLTHLKGSSVVLNLSWSVALLPRCSVPVAPCPVGYSMFEAILKHSPQVKVSAGGPRLRNAGVVHPKLVEI